MTKYGLGRGHFRDSRDDGFELKIGNSGRVSRYWPESRYCGDQGGSAHCVGFAWAHWLAAAPITNRLDPVGVYEFAKHIDEWVGEDYDGTSVRAGAKVLQKLGFIDEYYWTWSLEGLIYALLEEGPVVVGTNWYEDMYTPDRTGKMHVTGEFDGGHAYLISGIDTDTRQFRIKNSWGRSWGDGGNARIDFDDMERLMNEDGEVCIATETNPLSS